SLDSHLLGGLANINKVVGDAVAKVPLVSKSKLDETLIGSSDWLDKFNSRKTEQTMNQFLDHQNSSVHAFIENINLINKIYNKPLELLFDNNNLYLSLSED